MLLVAVASLITHSACPTPTWYGTQLAYVWGGAPLPDIVACMQSYTPATIDLDPALASVRITAKLYPPLNAKGVRPWLQALEYTFPIRVRQFRHRWVIRCVVAGCPGVAR